MTENKKSVRLRFAPSPTGYLHVGGLRTALYSYLFAKQQGSSFILRIEDTDRERFVEGGIENLIKALQWAGLNNDEGVFLNVDNTVSQKGDFGPYIQSERLPIYQKYVNELLDKGHAFYCFCSRERLDEVRKTQELNKLPTGYDGTCKNLDINDAKKRVEAGEKCVVRMKMPDTGVSKFVDLIRGEVEFKNELIDDQVILKSDGYPTYHLAVVVDDHLMGITHTVRAEEWLSSTPKHLVLYEMFGWQPPEFAHLSLLLNPDKSKLSKRQGDVSVDDYRLKGYLPEALVNFVALLGWNPGTEQEIFSMQELINAFSFEKVNKTGAVFNLEKLDWMNGEYIKNKNTEELVNLCAPYLQEAGLVGDSELIKKAIELSKDRLKKLSEIPTLISFVFSLPEYSGTMLVWRKADVEITKNRLATLISFFEAFSGEWKKELFEEKTLLMIKENALDNGTTLWPMRVALSGAEQSPGPFEIADVLGKDETLKRLNIALQKLS